MTYDEISSEISKLKSKLSQRKSQFSEAKTGVEELKSTFSNFDDNNLNYDKKDYQKVISLFDSGDYQKAQSLSKQAIQEGQSTFSAMEDAKESINHLESVISHLKSSKVKYDKKAYDSAVSDFESGDYLIAQSTADSAIKDAEGSLSGMEKVTILRDELESTLVSYKKNHGLSLPDFDIEEINKLIASNEFKKATNKINIFYSKIGSLLDSKEKIDEHLEEYKERLKEAKNHMILDESKFSIDEISQLIKSHDFEKALKNLKTISASLTKTMNQSPTLEFDFPQGLVAKEWNKVTLGIRNTGPIHIDDVKLDFEGIDQRKSFNFKRIESGEEGNVVGALNPEDPGSLEVKAIISYSTFVSQTLDEEIPPLEIEEWIDVLRPGSIQQESRPEIKVSKPVPKTVAGHRSEVPEWNKPKGLKGNDITLLEFFERRWNCYSKWPNNKAELDYLHNNQSKFQIESYFEIPTDPSTVLNEWALPDNLRGNVFLDDQRNSHVRQILASPIDTNFVIIGEPGVGKTVMLYEAFDSLMDKVPSGILTTSTIGDAHTGFGMRLFYDDIPENQELVDEISTKGAKGLVVSAREADWNRLDSKFKNQFQRLTVPLFSDKDIVSLCHRMLDFSTIKYDDAAIEQLKTYAQGSPIFVWSLIREMLFSGIRLLTNTYVKDNSRKGMENYVSLILQKLLKDGQDYKPGGLHTLGCLLFLSEYMKDKKCHEILFRSFAEIVEPDFEDIFGDRQSTNTFNQTIAYLSGEGSLIRFPHDTWADVIEGHGSNMNPFKAVIQDIRRKISDPKYERYKREAVIDTWEQIVRRYRRNSVRERDSFLALSDVLTNNFTLSELEKDIDEDGEADVDVEMIREVCSSNSELPIAARVLSRIQASKPNQINKIININDSVINRSNLNFEGEENIEDSVINRNNKV